LRLRRRPPHVSYYAKPRIGDRIRDGGALSERTILHHHRVLFEALKRAERLRIITRNPRADVDPPRPKEQRVAALDHKQLGCLLDAAHGTRLHAPILVAVTTGMRLGGWGCVGSMSILMVVCCV
jgi:integrase